MKATIRKATPAQKRLPVNNQTTKATIAPGRTKRITLTMITIMTMPMIKRNKSIMTSNMSGKPSEGKGKATIGTFLQQLFILNHIAFKFLAKLKVRSSRKFHHEAEKKGELQKVGETCSCLSAFYQFEADFGSHLESVA
jgi:hypothetical protein